MCKRLFGLLIPLLLLCRAYAGQTEGIAPAQKEALRACLPADGFYGGLKLETPVRFYDASNLYEYIDGQAEGYIAYNFQALASATYAGGDDSVVIDLYDMEKPLQAFGIYSSFRAPSNEFVDIGFQAFKTTDGFMYCKGRFAVKIAADYLDESEMFKAAEAAARATAAKIASDTEGLGILDLLPAEGKIADSDRYYLSAVLGQSFLSNGVVAEYPAQGGAARLFACDFGTPEAAAKAFGEYRKFATAHGTPPAAEGTEEFFSDVKYYGRTFVFRRGRLVAGGVSLPPDWKGLATRLKDALAAAEKVR